MERRVPKSQKYGHIQGRLNTGLTVDKVRSVSAREYSRRRDEIYFRLTPSQLHELLSEYDYDEFESIQEMDQHGDGQPRIVTYSESATPVYSKPYLILDVRDEFDYNTCHVMHARSYPVAMIRRDHMHPDIYSFKNKPDMLIIVYCDDERVSRDAAKTLVDRGVDNIFLLSGGLAEFAPRCPSYLEPPRLEGRSPSYLPCPALL